MKHFLITTGAVVLGIFAAGIFLESAGKGNLGRGFQGIAGNITRGYGAP